MAFLRKLIDNPDDPYPYEPGPAPSPGPGPVDPGDSAPVSPWPIPTPEPAPEPPGGGGHGGGGGQMPGAPRPIYNLPPPPKYAPVPGFTPPPPLELPSTADLTSNPGYQFRLQGGTDALQKSAAAKGVLRTGGTLKDLLEYGQNFASNEYGNVFGRARDIYDRSYQGVKDQYAPQLAEWQTKSQGELAQWQTQAQAEMEAALAQYQRQWQMYAFGRGGGGGGQQPIEPPPDPRDYAQYYE